MWKSEKVAPADSKSRFTAQFLQKRMSLPSVQLSLQVAKEPSRPVACKVRRKSVCRCVDATKDSYLELRLLVEENLTVELEGESLAYSSFVGRGRGVRVCAMKAGKSKRKTFWGLVHCFEHCVPGQKEFFSVYHPLEMLADMAYGRGVFGCVRCRTKTDFGRAFSPPTLALFFGPTWPPSSRKQRYRTSTMGQPLRSVPISVR